MTDACPSAAISANSDHLASSELIVIRGGCLCVGLRAAPQLASQPLIVLAAAAALRLQAAWIGLPAVRAAPRGMGISSTSDARGGVDRRPRPWT
jgi:hypothetical protein